MNDLPVKKICTRCGNAFYCMPTRLSKTPGTGLLCRHCRMAALDAVSDRDNAPGRANQTKADILATRDAAEFARDAKLYPCRICGAMSVNRFYCPDHHQQITMETGPYAEDFGFGSDEGIASRATFMDHVDTPPSET